MPDEKPAVSQTRQRLAAQLRAARTLAGLNQYEMADRVGRSQGYVSRVERGERLLSWDDTSTWLTVANAGEDVRDRVLALVGAAHAEGGRWLTAFGDQPHLQGVIRDLDRAAALVQNFQPSVLPGLLQTVDYARAVINIVDGQRYRVAGVDPAAALAARIERQALLREPGRSLQFLVAERLLRWEPAPGVLGPQLAQIVALSAMDAVELAVLPDGFADVVPWHNFIVRHPADGSPATVAAELLHGPANIEDAESVALYQKLWRRMWDGAIKGGAALDLIQKAAA